MKGNQKWQRAWADTGGGVVVAPLNWREKKIVKS